MSTITVAYIFERYPVLTQTFLRRELAGLSRAGVRLEIHSMLAAGRDFRFQISDFKTETDGRPSAFASEDAVPESLPVGKATVVSMLTLLAVRSNSAPSVDTVDMLAAVAPAGAAMLKAPPAVYFMTDPASPVSKGVTRLSVPPLPVDPDKL